MHLTRRRWYLVAALIAALAWVAGTAFAASAWDPLRDAEVVPVGQPIQSAGDDDLAVLTDLPQAERDIRCVARSGKKRIPVPAATVDIVVDSDGSRWHLLGVLSDAPDQTRIVCKPKDGQTDTARYGTAVVDLSSRVGTGQAIAWTGFIAGLGLAGATLTARTRRTLAHD
ncbi:hypothetical protein [Aeromicrobium duanguangcaii]|uniref:Sortase n=1 Tax=Aeromicrobium duanguangcaii TaxID=2968086 RepID=A0ABY5KFV8_9ACTN|nr:hypothetical protein [Aeromicrobium duanguangcaii]MCD9155392.1 hypothetical protein [Aeromicrobium duanguangcaii]MCL3838360.1 hypothetical protein [Aeromicrobium duanguangcaii]UUI68336.1 hypothetical protein NP095_14180 [Aeromicrobium duanguangcaii]